MNKKKTKKGFTLVELLAVIVVLAIILVIAVPQIMNTIEESKNGVFSSSAKLIAASAEAFKVTNDTLEIEKTINCDDVTEYNNKDYQSCSITFDEEGTARVTLVGKGKFAGKYVCAGTRTNAEVTTESCSEVCSANEELKVYSVTKPYEVDKITSCVSVITERLTLVGYTDYVPMIEPLCNGQTVEGVTFDYALKNMIQLTMFTEEELIESNVIKEVETEELEVCIPNYGDADTYITNLSSALVGIGGLQKTNATYTNDDSEEITVDAGIRYVGTTDAVANKVYFNCEATDGTNAYGHKDYKYDKACETWRIIGVFDVEDGSGNTEKRVKIINTESTFNASWDSSAIGTNSGVGVNQWGSSTLTDGSAYAGADLMQLLNGYYIGKSGSECKYNNTSGQDGFGQTCTKASLTDAGMKPLTDTAYKMIDNAVWYTYATDTSTTAAATTYLQERGITQQYVGNSLCTAGTAHCDDKVNRTKTWTGLVGLMSVSDITYANGWLYTSETGVSYAWTISPRLSSATVVGLSLPSSSYGRNASDSHGVWPAVYLDSNVQIIGGDGLNTPYKLSVQ